MTDLFSLRGRLAVVTGGAGQVGGEIARGLAGCGADVAICDIAQGMIRWPRYASSVKAPSSSASSAASTGKIPLK